MRAAALAAAALLFAPSLAHAQGVPAFQSGTVIPNHVLKGVGNGQHMDAGGLFGDANGRGVAPFSITDALGLGVCSHSAVTRGEHYEFCLGHDSDGNALLSVSANGGATEKNLKLSLNGSLYDLPGAGTGNISGPVSTSAGHLAVWNGTGGTVLADSAIGGIVPSLTIPSGAIAGAVPGFHLANGIGFRKEAATATDGNNVLIVRDADYTGGSSGFVNAALQVATVTHPGSLAYEWAGLFYIYNQGTFSDGSQNVGLYSRARKLTTGGTWGATFECDDYNTVTTPTNPCVALELDVYANGADPGTNRTGLHIVANKLDPAGSIPNVNWAIKIGESAAAGTFTSGIDFRTNFVAGIDFRSGTYTSAAIWLPDAVPVIWATDGSAKQYYDPGTSGIVMADGSNNIRHEFYAATGQLLVTDGTASLTLVPLGTGGIVATASNHDLVLQRNLVEGFRLTATGIKIQTLPTVAAGTGKTFLCYDAATKIVYNGTGASCN